LDLQLRRNALFAIIRKHISNCVLLTTN
jgi:hypothetical protein